MLNFSSKKKQENNNKKALCIRFDNGVFIIIFNIVTTGGKKVREKKVI